jgi:hypothetical protein
VYDEGLLSPLVVLKSEEGLFDSSDLRVECRVMGSWGLAVLGYNVARTLVVFRDYPV